MPRILNITLKELTIITRDRTALLLMIAAPLALTLVLSFAFSGLSGGDGLPEVPVLVVSEDRGELGQALEDLLTSDELSDLLAPERVATAGEARALVDDDKAAAAVLIPSGLTEGVTSGEGGPVRVVVYTNPGRPIGAGVVRGIVDRFAAQVAAGATGAEVTITQLVATGRLSPAKIPQMALEIGQRIALASVDRQLITLDVVQAHSQSEDGFDFLAYYAPGMAILFLMFSMTSAARTFITERNDGTFDRLRATPTSETVLLTGKVSGVLATGLLQMLALILATRLLMGVHWGDLLPVAVHVILVVTAMASLGLALAALARSLSQANALGSGVVMVLAAVGGNFVPRPAYPDWMRTLSYVGPNSWGIEGFQKLAAGGGLADLVPEFAALLAMTVIFSGLATWGFRRNLR